MRSLPLDMFLIQVVLNPLSLKNKGMREGRGGNIKKRKEEEEKEKEGESFSFFFFLLLYL